MSHIARNRFKPSHLLLLRSVLLLVTEIKLLRCLCNYRQLYVFALVSFIRKVIQAVVRHGSPHITRLHTRFKLLPQHIKVSSRNFPSPESSTSSQRTPQSSWSGSGLTTRHLVYMSCVLTYEGKYKTSTLCRLACSLSHKLRQEPSHQFRAILNVTLRILQHAVFFHNGTIPFQ